MSAFCEAIRVRDKWWKQAEIGTLAKSVELGDAAEATEQEFWEDVDDLGA